MSYRQELGLQAEEAAARYLRASGFEILEQRWRWGHKELDLVARRGDLVIFVEVKRRRSEAFGPAALSIPAAKRRRLVEAARGYLLEKELAEAGCSFRFDVILFHPAARDTQPRLEHITDAFRA